MKWLLAVALVTTTNAAIASKDNNSANSSGPIISLEEYPRTKVFSSWTVDESGHIVVCTKSGFGANCLQRALITDTAPEGFYTYGYRRTIVGGLSEIDVYYKKIPEDKKVEEKPIPKKGK